MIARCDALEEELEGDPALAPLFRRSGGLRAELGALAAAARAPDVVYAGPLMALHARAELLVDALALGPAAAAAGKDAERALLLKVLDALRSAKRTELPALLVQLHRLVASLARVPGLSLQAFRQRARDKQRWTLCRCRCECQGKSGRGIDAGGQGQGRETNGFERNEDGPTHDKENEEGASKEDAEPDGSN
jgi:hypothetical protein